MAGKEGQKKRFWSDEEKVSICLQPCTPGVFVAQVARRYAMNANLIHEWLRDPRFGGLYGCARDERSRDTGCYPRKGQEDHAQQEIALYRAQGLGVCAIARKTRRSASSISRERRRNAQHARAALSIAQPRLNGLPIVRHVGPKRQNCRKTMSYARMLKIGFRVRYRTRMGPSSQHLMLRGQRDGLCADNIADAPQPGAQNKAPAACHWTFRMTPGCASVTKQYIRPCSFRDV